ncbi:MAG: flagellar biosynthetic protein FliO [Firmicutes bacterium]|nr:flagellar biosynthetic protein FliO [Bacillota bacterium]
MFGLVLALAYFTTRLLGRRMTLASPGRVMRLVDHLALGPGRGLFLVEVGGRLLVVGSSEGSLSLLASVDDPDEVQACLNVADSGGGLLTPVGPTGAPGFAARLRSALARPGWWAPPQGGAALRQTSTAPAEGIRTGIRRLRDLGRGKSSDE